MTAAKSIPTTALIVDVDGVVSPVDGHTAWGDDVVAGRIFGGVLVSPSLCERLDSLGASSAVSAWWLTSWPASLRGRMSPFPGHDWPSITGQPTDPDLGWWKWAALPCWLGRHDSVRRIAWCDDHLADDHLFDVRLPDSTVDPDVDADSATAIEHGGPFGRAAITTELSRRHIEVLLVAPKTTVGITPHELDRVAKFCRRS